MSFIGIVNKIKDEHESGVYSRRELTEQELSKIKKENSFFDWYDLGANPFITVVPLLSLFSIGRLGYKFITKNKLTSDLFGIEVPEKENKNPLKLVSRINGEIGKMIIIENSGLEKNYYTKDHLLYGLFDGFPDNEEVFKDLMSSRGGTSLTIFEKKHLPDRFKHFSGINGKFSEGIYCSHPKDESLLIPLSNFENIVQSLILEEVIRTYEALGAKKILIQNLIKIESGIGGSNSFGSAELTFDYHKEILREKQYGIGVFDPERAIKNKLFIHDYPAIMSTIEGRINGNQIRESFVEMIKIDLGIDLKVLKRFAFNSNFNYTKKWSFEVDFFDKNELNNTNYKN